MSWQADGRRVVGATRVARGRHTQGVNSQDWVWASAVTLVCALIAFYVQKRLLHPSPRTNIVAVDFQRNVARMPKRRVASTDIEPVSVAGTITFAISDQRILRYAEAIELMEHAILREVDARINAMSGMAAIVHGDELRAALLRALAALQGCGITVTEVRLYVVGPGGEQYPDPPLRFIA
jgi:hypothetical protein